MSKSFQFPSDAIDWSKKELLHHGFTVKTERWQGIESPDDMHEIMFHSFKFIIPETITELVKEVRPNLPWADDHFEERVSGQPMNPPPSNAWWTFNQKGNEQFKKEAKFSHTYPERIWPKYAAEEPNTVMQGVRYQYGDFDNVLDLLEREPYTRQAYLPMWFPEDTGSAHGERVPCTLGWHFMRRGDNLHVSYGIRSCDLIRHFRDDIYLACRKVFWIIEKMQERDPVNWSDVKPGWFKMDISSLHCFNKEKGILKQNNI